MTAYAYVLDLCPAYGWQGGPGFDTRITKLRNGHERRNANRSLVEHSFMLPFQNIDNEDYLRELKGVFLAMLGMTHSFLAKDHSDFQAFSEPLGPAPAGSTAVQLVKVSTAGIASYTRTITKPKAGSVTVFQDDGSGNPVAKAGTLDTTTGLFTPTTAWTAGRALTWTGEFYVPVRFASDSLAGWSIDNRGGDGYSMNGSVDLIEVFGE